MPFPLLALPALIGAGSALAGGIMNSVSQKKANQTNVNLQRETNQQNEMLTRESWARDDNAVQRRAADLKAAGLSQTLAAGSPAGTSAPIRVNAASVDSTRSGDSMYQVSQIAQQMLQQQADYSMTKAQTNLINMQADKARAEAGYAQKELDHFDKNFGFKSETHDWSRESNLVNNASTRARTSIDQYDYELAKKWNVPVSYMRSSKVAGLFNAVEASGVRYTDGVAERLLELSEMLDNPNTSNFQKAGETFQQIIRMLPGGNKLFELYNWGVDNLGVGYKDTSKGGR